MLNVFRDNLKHLKPVLWLVVIGLVGYLGYYFRGADDGGGASAAWAARVDGSPIATTQYATALNNVTDYYRQLMGEQFEKVRPQLNLGQQVIARLVDEQIQLKEAAKLGIATSPEEIAHYIQNDPQLRDPKTGLFVGKEAYASFMDRRWPGGVAEYERSIGDLITVQKWIALATEAVDVTDAEIEDAYRARAEKTKIDYALVPAADQVIEMRVGDSEVAGWYGSHIADYQRGEARRIRYLLVDRQAQAAKVQVGDSELQAFYDANGAQFTRPEQRRASHILFSVPRGATPDQKEAIRKNAEDALARARGGADFAALATAHSGDEGSAKQGGDVGWFGRGAMTPTFEEAAFSTPVGELAPLTESPFGFHVIRVTDSREAGTEPFAEVKASIKRQLEQQKAQELVQSEAGRIRALVTSAQDLDAVAAKEQMTVEERVLARDERPGDLGPSPQFMDVVFSQAPGEVSPPLGSARGMAIVTVSENLPPAVRPFDEVKDRVRSDLLNARKSEAAKSAAAAALAKFKTVAAATSAKGWDLKKGVDAVPKQPLPGTGGTTPELERALFGPTVAKGATGAVPVPSGALLYEITEVERFDPVAFRTRKDGLRDELLTQKKNGFLQVTMDGLRNRYKDRIEVNTELITETNR